MAKKDKKNAQEPTMEEPASEQTFAAQPDQGPNSEIAEEMNAKGSRQPAGGDQIGALNKENNELKDKYLRLRAEFDNFRKRTLKEKLEDRKLAKKDIMSELLPILDDFDRAHKVAVDSRTVESVSEGMRLVYHKFVNTLIQQGLEVMESNEMDFDPELHEAIAEIPAPTEEMKGKVIDTVEKGYKLNGVIIRHPKVVVGK